MKRVEHCVTKYDMKTQLIGLIVHLKVPLWDTLIEEVSQLTILDICGWLLPERQTRSS